MAGIYYLFFFFLHQNHIYIHARVIITRENALETGKRFRDCVKNGTRKKKKANYFIDTTELQSKPNRAPGGISTDNDVTRKIFLATTIIITDAVYPQYIFKTLVRGISNAFKRYRARVRRPRRRVSEWIFRKLPDGFIVRNAFCKKKTKTISPHGRVNYIKTIRTTIKKQYVFFFYFFRRVRREKKNTIIIPLMSASLDVLQLLFWWNWSAGTAGFDVPNTGAMIALVSYNTINTLRYVFLLYTFLVRN